MQHAQTAHFHQQQTPVSPSVSRNSSFTLKKAVFAGLILGVMYTGFAAVVANQMASDISCTAAEFTGS